EFVEARAGGGEHLGEALGGRRIIKTKGGHALGGIEGGRVEACALGEAGRRQAIAARERVDRGPDLAVGEHDGPRRAKELVGIYTHYRNYGLFSGFVHPKHIWVSAILPLLADVHAPLAERSSMMVPFLFNRSSCIPCPLAAACS